MNRDRFLAQMLAWRQVVGRNPALAAGVKEEWDAWLLSQGADPPDMAKALLVVVADISCAEDVTAHIALAQLLALGTLRFELVLSLPTEMTTRIVREQAARAGWHGFVHIVDSGERLRLLERLPEDSPLAVFPGPAILSPKSLEKMFAATHDWRLLPQQGDESDDGVFVWGKGFFGRAGDYAESLAAPARRAKRPSAEALQLLSGDPTELGLCTAEREPPARNQWPKANAPLETAKSDEGTIDLSLVEPGDEIVIRSYRGPLPSTAFERRCARLFAAGEELKIRLPGSMLTTAPKVVQLESYKANGRVIASNLLVRVPPSHLKPSMVSAYLNKGGGGNGVIHAFANGIGCRLAYAEDEPEVLSDVPVVWGVLRDSDRILAQAKAQGLYFFYIDHAYFNRGHGKTYRISRNRYEAGPVRKCPGDRAEGLGIRLLPWRKGGTEILVCPPTDYFMAAHDCLDWLETTLAALGEVTDRPVIVREKPKEGETAVPLPKALETAHALVTHSSNVAIEAACLGTPVFVSTASAAAPIGRTHLSQIEDPAYPDRTEWLAHLAYNQFSFEEIEEGRAWQMLLELEERELA
jgi:hypothetical protein